MSRYIEKNYILKKSVRFIISNGWSTMADPHPEAPNFVSSILTNGLNFYGIFLHLSEAVNVPILAGT